MIPGVEPVSFVKAKPIRKGNTMFWQAMTWGLGIGLGAGITGLVFGFVLRGNNSTRDLQERTIELLEERNEIGRLQERRLYAIGEQIKFMSVAIQHVVERLEEIPEETSDEDEDFYTG